MPGESFVAGEQKVRPSTYVRIISSGAAPPQLVKGTVAAIVRGPWGPMDPSVLESERSIPEVFADVAVGTFGLIKQAFRGRARRVKAFRQGTGGVKATVSLQDAAALDVVRVDAKYVGTRGNAFRLTKRASLLDAAQREVILAEGGVELERFTYTPGAAEPQALVDAINANSRYLDAVHLAAGDGTVDNVTNEPLATGTDPTVDGASLTAALTKLETEDFNILVTDVIDAASHTTIEAWIDSQRAAGRFVRAVVAEPPSVAFATRETNVKAINNKAIIYVGNGFDTAEGTIQGYEAGGRVAGMEAAAELTASLTNAVVDGGTAVEGRMTNAEMERAIKAGMLAFSTNPTGQVVVEYGITALSTPGDNEDDGWKKIRRTRTRDELIKDMIVGVDPLRGRVNNDSTGRALVQARLNSSVARFVALGALLPTSRGAFLDPGNVSEGDAAFFVVDVDDIDSIEKLYLTFEFRFSPVGAAA